MSQFYGTFIDHWPAEISALSIKTKIHPLSEHDKKALLSQHSDTRTLIGCGRRLQFSDSLLSWINESIKEYPNGVFARLGSCSFVTEARLPNPAFTTEHVVKLLMHPGERAAMLSYRCHIARQPISLCIRDWQDFPPWSEFRMFIKNKKLVGISQYHWRRCYPEIHENIDQIVRITRNTAIPLLESIHLDSVVADIYINCSDSNKSWTLIELNPFLEYTDACLFSWQNGGDFDNTFRYKNDEDQVIRLAL